MNGQDSLASWSLFGNKINNVRSVHQNTSSGEGALKLYGQFNGVQNFSGLEQGVSVLPGDAIQVSAQTRIDSADSIAGTGNQAFLKFDFYNTPHGAYGTGEFIGSEQVLIADSSTPNDQWVQRQLTATAPAGAVEARIAVVFRQVNDEGGAVFVDNIVFGNETATDTVEATAIEVEAGVVVAGDLAGILQSDDNWLQLIAEPLEDSGGTIQITAESISPFPTPSGIAFQIESGGNSGNIVQSIELFNYDSGVFESFSNAEAGLSDGLTEFVVSGNPESFVRDGDRQMLARITWQANGPTLLFPWKARIDQVSWTIQR